MQMQGGGNPWDFCLAGFRVQGSRRLCGQVLSCPMLEHPGRRAYDHRLRDLVCETRDLALAGQLGVPRSTAASWIRRGPREVVSASVVVEEAAELRVRVLKLERRIEWLLGMVRLLVGLVRAVGLRLDEERLPSGSAKGTLLRAVARAVQVIPLSVALRLVGLSASRYHAWRRLEQACSLDDRTSCPHSSPTQLTVEEVRVIHDMVTAEQHRHMPVGALAMYAQRLGKVFAAPATWARLIKERGWLRPRKRLYPDKPTEGIRASRPGEILHIDVTIIKLVDGTKTYLHAVIDNFSRRILAWKLAARLEPVTTCQVLAQAAKELCPTLDPANPTTVMADSGVENVNAEVDDLLGLHHLRLLLAQVEVAYSNSLIEAWWRSLKYGGLFLHDLHSFAALEKLIGWYVGEHNAVIPHSAFRGQTPDEMFFGRGDQIPDELDAARRQARADRLESNRALSCERCRAGSAMESAAESIALSEREAA
jgi:putative transposase